MSANQVPIARALAHFAHLGQTDKAGQPYIEHPSRVARRVVARGGDEYDIAAAWLHDVLEDTAMTEELLVAAGMDSIVVRTVVLLTRRADQQPSGYYAAIYGSARALLVKSADIADNTDPNRLVLLPPEVQVRLIRKYARARTELHLTEENR